VRAVVTLDALGTLVALQPPAPLLAAELARRGVNVSERQAARAVAAEIAFYRRHHDSASDARSLDVLRDRCTQVLAEVLVAGGVDLGQLQMSELRAALLAALRFHPFPEVATTLRELRSGGHRLVVVSNWDVSLHDMLATAGLSELVDGAISSAEAGSSKPAPAIFERALALVGATAAGGLHAGDSIEYDVEGARAAGVRAVLVVRAGRAPAVPEGVAVIGSLTELPGLAA